MRSIRSATGTPARACTRRQSQRHHHGADSGAGQQANREGGPLDRRSAGVGGSYEARSGSAASRPAVPTAGDWRRSDRTARESASRTRRCRPVTGTPPESRHGPGPSSARCGRYSTWLCGVISTIVTLVPIAGLFRVQLHAVWPRTGENPSCALIVCGHGEARIHLSEHQPGSMRCRNWVRLLTECPARCTPCPFAPDRRGESALQDRVEIGVGGGQHHAQDRVQLVRGQRPPDRADRPGGCRRPRRPRRPPIRSWALRCNRNRYTSSVFSSGLRHTNDSTSTWCSPTTSHTRVRYRRSPGRVTRNASSSCRDEVDPQFGQYGRDVSAFIGR